MKILVAHNSHRSGSSSGDDIVFKKEVDLLMKHGHQITKINPSNDEYDSGNVLKKSATILQIPWSFDYHHKIRCIIEQEKPDIIHLHNIFPLISPSVFYAARSAKVPAIQTLHDFRYLCPMAFFLRGNKICKECIGGKYHRAVLYGCFKNSRIRSIMPVVMDGFHTYLETYKRMIDAYICVSKFQQQVFLDVGFNKNILYVKPNFVEDTFVSGDCSMGDYVVFIGRLGEEKGIRVILNAWRYLSDVPLKIIGEGLDGHEFKNLAYDLKTVHIEFMGYKEYYECMKILKDARFLIMPSIWYETFGLTIIEAFCYAKPVIASNFGAMAELVKNGETGLLFEPGNAKDLTTMVKWLWGHPDECQKMGKNAREEYEAKYTPLQNYKILMDIYQKTIDIYFKKSK